MVAAYRWLDSPLSLYGCSPNGLRNLEHPNGNFFKFDLFLSS